MRTEVISTCGSILCHAVCVLAVAYFTQPIFKKPEQVIAIDLEVIEHKILETEDISELETGSVAEKYTNEDKFIAEATHEQYDTCNAIQVQPEEDVCIESTAQPEETFNARKSQKKQIVHGIARNWHRPAAITGHHLSVTIKVEITEDKINLTIIDRPAHLTPEWIQLARSAVRATIRTCKEYRACITEDTTYIFKFDNNTL